jgi:hypothetical protein
MRNLDFEHFTVAESQRILHAPKIEHTANTVIAAYSLMQVCEHDLAVTIDDMLRCLDYGGTIATVGARCLYVRTGRDGHGWTPGAPKGKRLCSADRLSAVSPTGSRQTDRFFGAASR